MTSDRLDKEFLEFLIRTQPAFKGRGLVAAQGIFQASSSDIQARLRQSFQDSQPDAEPTLAREFPERIRLSDGTEVDVTWVSIGSVRDEETGETIELFAPVPPLENFSAGIADDLLTLTHARLPDGGIRKFERDEIAAADLRESDIFDRAGSIAIATALVNNGFDPELFDADLTRQLLTRQLTILRGGGQLDISLIQQNLTRAFEDPEFAARLRATGQLGTQEALKAAEQARPTGGPLAAPTGPPLAPPGIQVPRILTIDEARQTTVLPSDIIIADTGAEAAVVGATQFITPDQIGPLEARLPGSAAAEFEAPSPGAPIPPGVGGSRVEQQRRLMEQRLAQGIKTGLFPGEDPEQAAAKKSTPKVSRSVFQLMLMFLYTRYLACLCRRAPGR